MNILKVLVCLLFLSQNSIVPYSVVLADGISSEINLIVGDLETIPVSGLTRVSVTNPEIADISDAQNDKVMLLAKKAGQTSLFLWDASGKKTISISIVDGDLKALSSRLANLLAKSDINVNLDANAQEGKVVISGYLSKQKRDSLDKIIDPYANQVINLVKEEINEELVQIDMQVTELNTTLSKNLGLEWSNDTGGTDKQLSIGYNETLPEATGKAKNLFKIGDFNRTNAIMATVNALIEEGKGRILSKPRLVVMSGKEASFLVGGEIPIRTTTTSATGGSTQENVQFKQYGINMMITPIVRDGRVDILLKVEISDIDKANKVGNDVAFLTRSAQTQLFLDNRQTIVLAGLIKHSDGETVKKVPILGSIPIVGALFRNRSTPTANTDTEMVISLTPTIIKEKKYATQEALMPSSKLTAYEAEQALEQTSLVKRASDNPPAAAPVVDLTPIQIPAKETVVAPSVPAPVASGPVNMTYVRSIQEKISQKISYPYEALENNWQGTVKLKLHILKDGTLANSSVIETSGHEIFDQDALNTAKISAPYAAFPAEMKNADLTVTIPIVYSQGNAPQSNSQTVTAAY